MHEDAVDKITIDKVKALSAISEERGQTLAQMALAWILRDHDITSVLIGASKPSQIIDNVGMLTNLEFSEDERNRIDAILK